jgi:hypothetical protein
MTKPNQLGIKLANGMWLRNGQIIPEGNSMTNIARDGRVPKRYLTNEPAPAFGMKRQQSGELADSIHHGVALDDEPNSDIKTYRNPPQPNPGTPSRSDRGQHIAGLGQAVLQNAADLGKRG